MTARRWVFFVLVGCASPLTVAEPRDGGELDDAATGSFGDAGVSVDASDEPPFIGDPPEDAGTDA